MQFVALADGFEVLAMRDDMSIRDVTRNRDVEIGKFVVRWGGREDNKPNAVDVRWPRGHSWDHCERWPARRRGWRGNWSVKRGTG